MFVEYTMIKKMFTVSLFVSNQQMKNARGRLKIKYLPLWLITVFIELF